MCSVPGYDASGRVDDLAAETNKSITSIAIGKQRVLFQGLLVSLIGWKTTLELINLLFSYHLLKITYPS